MANKETEEISEEDREYLRQLLGTEAVSEPSDFPEPPKKYDVIQFFRDILGLERTDYDKISRTGFLKEEELGNLVLPVRAYHNFANYSETEKYDKVAEYLRNKANIIFNSSLSRKGFFITSFNTQKKISKNVGQPRREEKTGLFGKTVVEEGEGDES